METALNILGTTYQYTEESERDNPSLCGDTGGLCDSYAKKIIIRNDYNENQPFAIQNFDELIKISKRHEVIHAYLFESGLTELAENEQLVQWIAWQFPKLLQSFSVIKGI